MKNTFPDVFQKFTKKNLVQMSYFEKRPEKVSVPKKKSEQSSPVLEEAERRSSRPIARMDVTQVHSPKYFEKRLEQLFSPKVKDNCSSPRTSVKSRDTSCSTPKSMFPDFNLNIIGPPKSMFKSPSHNKRDFSLSKDAYGLTDYDVGISSYRQPTESDTLKANKGKSCDTSQEYSVEKTMKILKEKAKLRRSLSKDFGRNSRSGMLTIRSTSNQPKN